MRIRGAKNPHWIGRYEITNILLNLKIKIKIIFVMETLKQKNPKI